MTVFISDTISDSICHYIYSIESKTESLITSIPPDLIIRERLLEGTMHLFDAMQCDKESLKTLHQRAQKDPTCIWHIGPVMTGFSKRFLDKIGFTGFAATPDTLANAFSVTSLAKFGTHMNAPLAYSLAFFHWFSAWINDDSSGQCDTIAAIEESLRLLWPEE